MNESLAHALAQDSVEACHPDGSTDLLGMAQLVLGGMAFLGLFGIWIATHWITGEMK